VLHELVLLAQGFILGLAMAAPVGPIGLLCIRRTIKYGPGVGFATGMGAAIADTLLGGIAAFGISTALSFLIGHQTAFRLVGGVFMLAVALRTFHQTVAAEESEAARAPPATSWISGFITGLTLTLTNPATIFAFIAIFAGFGLGADLGDFDAASLVTGVFFGSASWWLALSCGVAAFRHRVTDQGLTRLNHWTGVGLGIFGVWALGTGLWALVPG
jgi:threonine/homoserine/homoserine lactone efflux protein